MPSRLYLVRSGLVVLSAVTQEGSERALILRGPSSLVCVEALQSRPSSFEVRALTDVMLCGAGTAALSVILGATFGANALISLLADELARRDEDAAFRQGDALSRVARFLAALKSPEEVGAIPKNVIARLLGLRAETLSRCLAVLTGRGVIHARPRLRVLDADALRALGR